MLLLGSLLGKLVEADGEPGHVPDPPGVPIPGGAQVIPALVLDPCSRGSVQQQVLHQAGAVCGAVLPVDQHLVWPEPQEEGGGEGVHISFQD